MREGDILRGVWLALSRGAVRLYRNQVGEAWLGKWAWFDRRVIIEQPQRVSFGLMSGSGDLIGWSTYTIQPDDVGKRVAVFLSIEVKGPKGRTSDEQLRWLNAVLTAGGIACITKDTRTAADFIDNWRPI